MGSVKKGGLARNVIHAQLKNSHSTCVVYLHTFAYCMCMCDAIFYISVVFQPFACLHYYYLFSLHLFVFYVIPKTKTNVYYSKIKDRKFREKIITKKNKSPTKNNMAHIGTKWVYQMEFDQ